MRLGVIDEGRLKGKKVILDPRNGLKENEWLVEEGVFMNGMPMFHKACLNRGCEEYIGSMCEECG